MVKQVRPETSTSDITTSTDDHSYANELAALLADLCHDYLTQASHTDLASFLRSRGIPTDWFIDMLQLTTHDDR